MANIITLTIVDSLRVRTASGEAHFVDPASGALLENDFEAGWIHLEPGSTVTLAAKFEKTDTFMVAYTTPSTEDESGEKIPALMTGLVLRRASWEKVVKAGEPVETVEA